jgi:hypothetical protein
MAAAVRLTKRRKNSLGLKSWIGGNKDHRKERGGGGEISATYEHSI